ncbi:MAG: hypothetical protein ACLR8P_12185 [Clostridium fessum]
MAFLAVLELMKMGRIHLVQENCLMRCSSIQWMWMKRKTRQSWNCRRSEGEEYARIR